MIADEEWVVILVNRLRYFKFVACGRNVKLVGVLLEKASATLITGNAIQGVLGNEKINDLSASLGQLWILGLNGHTVCAG